MPSTTFRHGAFEKEEIGEPEEKPKGMRVSRKHIILAVIISIALLTVVWAATTTEYLDIEFAFEKTIVVTNADIDYVNGTLYVGFTNSDSVQHTFTVVVEKDGVLLPSQEVILASGASTASPLAFSVGTTWTSLAGSITH